MRTRDENGHFVAVKDQTKVDLIEVKSKLAASEEESKLLKDKLATMERELAFLRQKAEFASNQQEVMQQELVNQKKMSNTLLNNKAGFGNDVFSTIKLQNSSSFIKKAFEEKIDFSNIELHFTNSPHLIATREENQSF